MEENAFLPHREVKTTSKDYFVSVVSTLGVIVLCFSCAFHITYITDVQDKARYCMIRTDFFIPSDGQSYV